MLIDINSQQAISAALKSHGVVEFLRQVETALMQETTLSTMSEHERLEHAAKGIAKIRAYTTIWIDKENTTDLK